MEVPDQKGRLSILKVHAKNKKLSEEVELASVAMRTPGFSGADLANLLNEVSVSFVLTLTALYIIVQRCHTRMMSSHSIVHMTRSKFAPCYCARQPFWHFAIPQHDVKVWSKVVRNAQGLFILLAAGHYDVSG